MGDIMIESPLAQKSPFLHSFQDGNKLWTSEENVQLWINTLEEREFSKTTSEASSPTKSSFESDVFLQLPGGGETDELGLGAEAKHYGHLSPRLSPLVSFDKDDKELEDICSNDQPLEETDGSFEDPKVRELDKEYQTQRFNELKQYLKHQNQIVTSSNSTPFFTPVSEIIEKVDPSAKPKKRPDSLVSQETESSFSSSFDRPSSLAAALRPDPEELLFNLGFCDQSSLLQTIPARFFLHQSEAYGIDVVGIHNSLLDDQESVVSVEPSSSSHVLHRFSESSIDLTSVTSTESSTPHTPLSAKTRRILFKSSRQDIPSIHLTRDEDRPFSPTSASITSSNSNWMKLETLEEVPEPNSRGSSFDYDHHTPTTPSKVRHRLENNIAVELRRKFSDTDVSRGGTLIDEDSESGNNHFVNNSLLPSAYKRTLSDKSISSIVTVIDHGENSTKSSFEKPVSDPSNLFKPVSDPSNLFKPIENKESIDEQEITTPSSTCMSAANRRSLFGSSKKDFQTTVSDNVFSSSESALIKPTIAMEVLSENPLKSEEDLVMNPPENHIVDISDVRKRSMNESFRDFIKTLASEGSISPTSTRKEGGSLGSKNDGESSTPQTDKLAEPQQSIEIFVHSPSPSVFNEEVTRPLSPKLTSPPLKQEEEEKQLDRENHEAKEQSSVTKKGYFSAAINSLTNVFGNKYQDSRQSNCEDIVKEGELDESQQQQTNEPSSPPVKQPKKQASSLFRLFNHQTLSVHSNSAFSSFVSGLSNGVEVELDQVSNVSVESNQKPTTNNNDNTCDHTNSRRENTSLNSNYNSPTSPGYIADSPISSDDLPCHCPTSPLNGSKRRNRHDKKHVMKGRSVESSGFDEDQREIKCPLGKNCSLIHKNGRHVYPSDTSDRLDVRKVSESSMGKYSNTSSVFTHEHFDFLVQQVTSLRSEVKEEFRQTATRENEMKIHLTEQMEEMKKAMTSEYMDWIANEMQHLKTKLNEKDEEIRRLRDVIASTEATTNQKETEHGKKRTGSFGTPV